MAREQVRKKPVGKAPPQSLDGGILMRDGALVAADPWVFVAEGEDGPEAGDIVVPLARFIEERERLLARNHGRLGVLIDAGDNVEDIAADLDRVDLAAIAFPGFKDGRGYSTARLLRDRYQFKGELRAVGDVLPDQLFFMLRCGFTAFALRAAHPLEDYARAAHTFSISYQGSSDARLPAHRLRAEKRKAVKPEEGSS